MTSAKKLFAIFVSIIAISFFTLFGDSITRIFPNNIAQCMQSLIPGAEVMAQSACTVPPGVDDSVSVWTSEGKLRESNVFHTPNGTNVGEGNVGIGAQYPIAGDTNSLYVQGDLSFGGTLVSGTVPFARVSGDVPFSRVTGNVPFSRVTGDVPFSRVTGNVPFSRVTGDVPWSRLSSLPSFASGEIGGRVTAAHLGCTGGWDVSCDDDNDGYIDLVERANYADNANTANTANTASFATNAGTAISAINSESCDDDSVCETESVQLNSNGRGTITIENTIFDSRSYLSINKSYYPFQNRGGFMYCYDTDCNSHGRFDFSGGTSGTYVNLTGGGTNSERSFFTATSISGSEQVSSDLVSADTLEADQIVFNRVSMGAYSIGLDGSGVSQKGVTFPQGGSGTGSGDNYLHFVQYYPFHTEGTTTYHDISVGTVRSSGAINYDLAEVMPSKPGDNLIIGELVIPDESGDLLVTRSTESDDPSVLGIVSNELTASMLIGGDTVPNQVGKHGNRTAIALAGRVITLVSLENGSIQSGDGIATASMPGYGAKAVGNTTYVSKAMEDFDGSSVNSPSVNFIIESLKKQMSDIPEQAEYRNQYSKLISQLTMPLPPDTGRIITYVEGGTKTDLTYIQESTSQNSQKISQLKQENAHLRKELDTLRLEFEELRSLVTNQYKKQ